MCDCSTEFGLLIAAVTAGFAASAIIETQENTLLGTQNTIIQSGLTDVTDATLCHTQSTDHQTSIIGTQEANQTLLYECELDRKNAVDISSLALAIATFLIYDEYYDKYEDIVDWRQEIADRIKACLELDIIHYKDVVMANMNNVISSILGSPTVSVEYSDIINSYNQYIDGASQAEVDLIHELIRKTCREDAIPCDHIEGDIEGWATMGAISAADSNARFDERRVPRRQDVISAALNTAHGSTFNLPAFDYQALSNAANIASSLATAYAGIANSALGSFGYFSTNFVNSLGGSFGGGSG